MDHVSDRRRNPFGIRAPCEGGDDGAVYGYGDPSADFHVVGDYPGAHGGGSTGVPFDDSPVGDLLWPVFGDLGFEVPGDGRSGTDAGRNGPRNGSDAGRGGPRNGDPGLFASYCHMCPTADGQPPDARSYDRLERYFDAELRAVNAHVLLPVGERATDAVLGGYTTQARKLDTEMAALHAVEIRGRGFMVVPVRDPRAWADGDRERLVEKLSAVLASDYRQTKGVATLVG